MSGAQREQQLLLDQAERRGRGRELNATWCSKALMRTPRHLFHRMWAAASWAPMEQGAPACWEVHRDAPHRRLSPAQFFRQTESGAHCQTNWYEGHSGTLGHPGYLPQFAAPAPALLGYDAGIHQYCAAAALPGASRDESCGADGPAGKLLRVARCCTMANFNILNMISQRVPYNLCRNLEWQVCAVLGKLPGQPAGDRSIRFANAPLELEVEPISSRSGSGPGARQARRRCDLNATNTTRNAAGNSTVVYKPGYAYSLSDIFHLELCMFNQICTNGHEIFNLKVGEAFVCNFSHERFTALANVLLNVSARNAKCGGNVSGARG